MKYSYILFKIGIALAIICSILFILTFEVLKKEKEVLLLIGIIIESISITFLIVSIILILKQTNK